MSASNSVEFGAGVQANSGVVYKTLRTLGSGGNATTYLVLATSGSCDGVPFAMKVFRAVGKPDARSRFLHEVQFLRSCNHPCVMRVYDDGILDADRPFVVFEYLPSTLADVLERTRRARRGQRLPAIEKISYIVQLLSALTYLAQQTPPVVHRDIKPSNIFVKARSCVLGDFGLIKHLHGEDAAESALDPSTGHRMPMRYRPPELVGTGVTDTCKSDVYQLGLVAAELFTGQNPQKPATSFSSPVERGDLGRIAGPASPFVRNLIEQMLIEDTQRRASAEESLWAWRGLFLSQAQRLHDDRQQIFPAM